MPVLSLEPVLVFGCSRLGSALTPLDRQASIALVRRAYDLGVRHFDTASIYGQGDSERLLGAALEPDRAKVSLASKAGQLLTPKQAALAHLKPLVRWLAARRGGLRQRVAQTRAQGVPRCFQPDFIERSLRESLARLRTDHLDIFYLHSPSPEVLGDAALFTRLAALQRQGLFLKLGVSCDDLQLAQLAAAHAAIEVVQYEFDGSAAAADVMQALTREGKSGLVRGFSRLVGQAWEGTSHAWPQKLRAPAFSGLVMGTTSITHLEQNVAAFRSVLNMGRDV
ncbi:aldo/keto reductase [Pseudorhodoferax sp. Leaf265]|uniref:aldo/keto reductase n=1 Tax=Pseudorhodoferax sp. Leaf265 TaxID=1736315 RepID=UPI00138F082F|nr:aldo/keto reductase [Pseudorhodoferax sp. Leaf265]